MLCGDRRGSGGGARGWANGTLSALDYLGAGVASLVFAGGQSPALWLARDLCDRRGAAVPGRLSAPQSAGDQTFRRPGKHREDRIETGGRPGAAARPGAAISRPLADRPDRGGRPSALPSRPPSSCRPNICRSVYHYTPGEVTALFIPGGLVGPGAGDPGGPAVRPHRPQAHGLRHRGLAAIGFALFYSGVGAAGLPPLWMLSFFGFFSGDALIAGFALEIVPTHYRATVSGLRYLVEISTGRRQPGAGRPAL